MRLSVKAQSPNLVSACTIAACQLFVTRFFCLIGAFREAHYLDLPSLIRRRYARSVTMARQELWQGRRDLQNLQDLQDFFPLNFQKFLSLKQKIDK